MPFKTLEQVWVESCDSPPNNTLSSVHLNVPKTCRHQVSLSGNTHCYSTGILPTSPPVPENFLWDRSSEGAAVRKSSNLLMVSKWCICDRKDKLSERSVYGLLKILHFNSVIIVFFFLLPSHLFIVSINMSTKLYHLRNKCLLVLIVSQTRSVFDSFKK